MEPGSLIVVGGGARSGKSRFALRRGRQIGTRRVFVATAEASDSEMSERIERHRGERGTDFQTVEEPRELANVLRLVVDADVVVIDCVTVWLSNLLLADHPAARVEREVDRLLDVVAAAPFVTIAVTNEVGMGVVPESSLGRVFRDVQGRANQRLATRAQEVYLAALGAILRLRPSPIESIG